MLKHKSSSLDRFSQMVQEKAMNLFYQPTEDQIFSREVFDRADIGSNGDYLILDKTGLKTRLSLNKSKLINLNKRKKNQ